MIVRRVDLLFERADAAECEVVAAGQWCERLTQVVMVNIFSGRLCPKIFEKNSSEFFECIRLGCYDGEGSRRTHQSSSSAFAGRL
jgi:hypothetical protein